MKNSLLFTPAKIGPLTLRNRTIRSAAFESMCENNSPTQMLEDYHVSVARGGIGMTTLAYASVTRNGLSFKRQLWMREEIVPGLAPDYRCDTPGGGGRFHSDRSLRQHVEEKRGGAATHIGFQRTEYLLAHFRARYAAR